MADEPDIDAATLAEVSRLAALPWREYDAARHAAAIALGMPRRELDRAVYRLRGAATAAAGRA